VRDSTGFVLAREARVDAAFGAGAGFVGAALARVARFGGFERCVS